jgi:hypothetical protein
MLSQNGWRVLQSGETRQWVIPGTGSWLRLHPGDAGFVLAHFALWHHDQIEHLDEGPWDDWGYALRPVRGQTSGYSNHASGTAMDLNAQDHPLGVRNTYRSDQQMRIRNRLRGRYAGCIRWGGDYQNRADEMHYEIDAGESAIRALAARLRNSHRGRRVWHDNG